MKHLSQSKAEAGYDAGDKKLYLGEEDVVDGVNADDLEIAQKGEKQDIGIVENAPVAENVESYPGVPLTLGDAGNNVKILQTELNRIRQNYPAIPEIEEVNGIFGVDTEEAVREFQKIFNLTQNGTVDKSTWYSIKRYYTGVKGLSELAAEGVTIDEASVPFSTELSEGMSGIPVRTVQYYLSIIAYFNQNLAPVPLNGIFDSQTVDAVSRFQEYYGLPVTGIVDTATWNTITRIYTETVAALPPDYAGQNAKLYPGYFLTPGTRNQNVTDLQTYLSFIGQNIGEIPPPAITGYYGEQTENAVRAFQRLFGVTESGSVGPVTWYLIAREYDALREREQITST